MDNKDTHKHFNFLGNSTVATAIHALGSNTTAIGNADNWPPELKFIVSYVVSSKLPTLLLWGKDGSAFYNDAFTEKLDSTITIGKSLNTNNLLNSVIAANVQTVKSSGEALLEADVFIPVPINGYLNDAWWSLSYTPVKDGNGNTEGVTVTFQDTTTNIRAIQSLDNLNQNMRLMVLQAPVAICVFKTADYIVDIVNPLMEQMLGRDAAHLQHKPFFEGMPELNNSGLKEILDDIWATGKSFVAKEQLFKLPRKNSLETVYVNYIYEPMKDLKGAINGIMVVAIDVTEQVYDRLKSEQNESSIRSIIKSAPFPIGVYVGPNMVVEFANKSLLDLWGKDKTVIGKQYAEIMPQIAKEIALQQLTYVYNTGIPFSAKNKLVQIYKEHGVVSYYLNYSFTPLYDNNGKIYGIMSTAADVTDLNLATQKIEESEEKFRSLIEEAPVATCLFTGQDMIIEVANPIMLKMWGKDKACIGKPLAEGVPELRGQPFINILNEVFTTGVIYSATDSRADLIVNGILRTFYFDFTYKPLFDSTGNVYGIMDMAVDVTDKLIAKQRIMESQQQLLDLFEQSPVGIAMLDKENLVFTMANSFYGFLVGREPSQLKGKSLLDALPELKGQGFDDLLLEVIATGNPFIANEVAVDLLRSGVLETIYVDLAYQPRRERDGSVSGILVVAIDVTQQVQSRKKVEASEAKMRSVIALAPAGMGLFVGRDLIIEMPNQTFIDIVGKGWDVVGKPLREAMPELITEGQPFLKILDDVFTSGKMYQSFGDQVLIVQNGVMSYNYYNITYTPIFNEDGQVYAILDIAIDVTDAVIARQKAEEAGKSLLGAVELAELAVWSYNIQDETYSYSQRFSEWFGFSDATKELDEAFNPLPEEYRELVPAAIKAAIQPGGSGIYKYEHPIINRVTDNEIIVNAQAQVFYDLQGKPLVLSGTARDVTKERKLQQELENQVKERTEKLMHANTELAEVNSNLHKSNSELGQFAYIASHDLQEPVRKISTFIKMLENTLGNTIDDRSKFYIQRIENSTQRMTSLIRDILGYSQLSKNSEVYPETDLNKIAEGVVSDFELIIEQKNATVTISNLPVIEAIPLQMTQLFGNLISNSIKYSRENIAPVINVTAQPVTTDDILKYNLQNEGYYKLIFKDNGIGFKQDYAQQIFNIFQRLHSKNEYLGTGIGLAMCKKIAQNHNGDIFAFSNEGTGSQFVVLLPVKHHE